MLLLAETVANPSGPKRKGPKDRCEGCWLQGQQGGTGKTLCRGLLCQDLSPKTGSVHQGLDTAGVKRGEMGQKEREEAGKAAPEKGSRGRGKGVGWLCVSLLCFDLASVREILC